MPPCNDCSHATQPHATQAGSNVTVHTRCIVLLHPDLASKCWATTPVTCEVLLPCMSYNSLAVEDFTHSQQKLICLTYKENVSCISDSECTKVATWKSGMNGSLEAKHIPGRLSSGQSSGNALLLRCAFAHACCSIAHSRGLASC